MTLDYKLICKPTSGLEGSKGQTVISLMNGVSKLKVTASFIHILSAYSLEFGSH